MELDFSEQIRAKWEKAKCAKVGVCKAGVHSPMEEKMEPKNHNEMVENEAAKKPHNAKEEAMEPKKHNEMIENEAAQKKMDKMGKMDKMC